MVLDNINYSSNIKYYKFHQRKKKSFQSIVLPLQYLNIDTFLYLKLVSKDKYHVMCTDNNIVQHILFNGCDFNKYVTQNLKNTKVGKLNAEFIDNQKIEDFILPINKNVLKISGISFFAKLKCFSEIFMFIQHNNDLSIIQNDLDNVNLLKRFMIYFREEFQKLLKSTKEVPHAVYLKKDNQNSTKSNEKKLSINLSIPSGPCVLRVGAKNIILSKQEAVYLYLLSSGNKGITIAELMGISFKRSNDILLNLKKKTNNYDRVSLMKLIENY